MKWSVYLDRNLYSIPALALALAFAASPQATAKTNEAPSQKEMFAFYTSCSQVGLLVHVNIDEKHNPKPNLSEDDLRNLAESRLRAARIYDPDYAGSLVPVILITVQTEGPSFISGIAFYKWMLDYYSALANLSRAELQMDMMEWTKLFGAPYQDYAMSWADESFGTHGGDDGYILSGVSRSMDKFIAEYLRVNAEACG